jgi:hypothetical protein
MMKARHGVAWNLKERLVFSTEEHVDTEQAVAGSEVTA